MTSKFVNLLEILARDDVVGIPGHYRTDTTKHRGMVRAWKQRRPDNMFPVASTPARRNRIYAFAEVKYS